MTKEALVNFVGTGMLLLPVMLWIGTGSLDAIAISLLVLLVLQIAVLVINPDDPIGDKLKAEAHKKDKPPQ
ncbi:MAG TPA: hypothetical protein VFY24_12185 [Azospira sp.]|nr:hypothetical protein [Azospira sp.]